MNRFEQLLQEEKVLMQEILAFDNKLESWLIACSPVAQKAAVVVASTSNAAVGSPNKLESETPDPVLVFEVSTYCLIEIHLKYSACP